MPTIGIVSPRILQIYNIGLVSWQLDAHWDEYDEYHGNRDEFGETARDVSYGANYSMGHIANLDYLHNNFVAALCDIWVREDDVSAQSWIQWSHLSIIRAGSKP